MSLDVLFINPNNANGIYQSLASEIAAVEPPTWALLLAKSCQSRGFKVSILDANAERLSLNEQRDRVVEADARLVVFVVYGQNVNAGTVSMSGAIELANFLKSDNPNIVIAFVGSYVQALPVKVLKDEKSINFVFTNEAVYALWSILELKEFSHKNLEGIKGIAYRDANNEIRINPSSPLVPTDRMDLDLPGYAWELLPFKKNPLDLYRAPLWHVNYNSNLRSPYAAIQTSIGCNFGCSFCMINIINRNDENEIGVASDYKGMRFWSTQFVIDQFDILNNLGVSTIKITDEMFLLYKKHYLPLCTELAKKPYAKDLMMWAYSRIDTVTNKEFLEIVRSAGIRWLALGIESADKSVRLEVTKGNFEDVDIEKIVRQVEDSGINVMANYIVGLPGDTLESMEKTLSLSKSLNTAGWNMYTSMALPGSELFQKLVKQNGLMEIVYSEFSWHSIDSKPHGTKTLSHQQVTAFRDTSFISYHSDINFLNKIRNKFGDRAVKSINDMLKIRIKRND